jgi:flagellar biosynthetic protein FliR
MPAELTSMESTAAAFILALGRVAAVFSFVPIPGVRNGLEPARVMLALVVTIALYPFWTAPAGPLTAGLLLARLVIEAAAGAAVGLAVGFVADSFAFCMQMTGLQAGYSFASTVDPTSQADSTVLLVLAQLGTGLLFLATGLHRDVIQALAFSFTANAHGPSLNPAAAADFLRLGSSMFSTGLRLAAPTCVLLLMLELALALAARANAQLQMLSAAFPVKMLAGLVMLALTVPCLPLLFSAQSKQALAAIARWLGN